MFISFEGLDGCGKTTQVELLEAFLEMRDVEVVATREPGGTELGETLRAIVLHGQKVSPWAEAAIFAAARAEAHRGKTTSARTAAGATSNTKCRPCLSSAR